MIGLGIGIRIGMRRAGSAPAAPVISGTAYQGAALTSDTATQWLLNGSPISGETGSSLTVPESVLLGDEITQAGSNSITVIRIPNACGIRVDTTKTGSASNRMVIPARNVSTYNCRVYWGDGTWSDVTTWDSANLTHDYATGGAYDIQIAGAFRAFYFNNSGDRQKLLRIDQWGTTGQDTNQNNAFYGCAALTTLPSDLTLAALTSGGYMFRGCAALTSLPSGMTLAALATGGNMFRDCAALTSLPSGMTLAALATGGNMFNGCAALTSLPSGMTLAALTSGGYMFYGCAALTTLPSGMTLAALTDGISMFQGCVILTASYSQLLNNMAASNPNSGVPFHGGNSKFNAGAAASRAALVSNSWTITDGGLE